MSVEYLAQTLLNIYVAINKPVSTFKFKNLHKTITYVHIVAYTKLNVKIHDFFCY